MTREELMREALSLAKQSACEGEVPVGAVIARDGEIVGTGRNRRETERNALCHAEIEAIDNACRNLGGWRLWQCELYVTLEPCPMCAGAVLNAHIPTVVFGAFDRKNGACGSVTNLFDLPFTAKVHAAGGFLETECAALLTAFFKNLRQKKCNPPSAEPT